MVKNDGYRLITAGPDDELNLHADGEINTGENNKKINKSKAGKVDGLIGKAKKNEQVRGEFIHTKFLGMNYPS